MLIRRDGSLLGPSPPFEITLGFKGLYPLAGHRLQRRTAHGVAEKRDAISRLLAAFALDVSGCGREHHPVHGATQQPVSPVTEQIANVDKNGRAWVCFGAGRAYGDGRPGVAARVELEAGLAAQAEEERDATVVGVGACADVGVAGLERVGGAERGQGRVVQEAQDVARRAVLAQVALVEEGGRLYGEADAKEVVDFEAERVAVVDWRWLVFYNMVVGEEAGVPGKADAQKEPIRLSYCERLSGIGCWALPSMNSPKLNALRKTMPSVDLGRTQQVRRRAWAQSESHSLKSPTCCDISIRVSCGAPANKNNSPADSWDPTSHNSYSTSRGCSFVWCISAFPPPTSRRSSCPILAKTVLSMYFRRLRVISRMEARTKSNASPTDSTGMSAP